MSTHTKKLYSIPYKLGLIIFSIDFAALLIASLVSNLYFPLFLHDDPSNLGSQVFNYYAFFNALIIFNFNHKGHYKNRVPWWQQMRAILKSIGTIILVTLITYFIFDLKISLSYVFISWILAYGLLIIGRIVVYSILPRFDDWKLPVTLFGDNQMVIDCMYAFYNDGQTGFEVETILLRDKNKKPICLNFIPDDHPPIKMVDASKDYIEYIKSNPDSFYIIGLEGIRGENRDKLINTLENNNINYAIVPPTKRLHLYGMEPHYFFGNDIMLLHTRKRPQEPLSRFIERALDILISGSCLPILA
ncbi:MAG: hypothetical protein KTR28_08155, partial [Micavibrio sp.]|nr:hypothetical protein [Micavibrio sp.]